MANLNLVDGAVSRNRKALEERSDRAGCYHCARIVDAGEIEDWTDEGETACCPKCGLATVIPGSYGLPLTEEYLRRAHEDQF